MTTTASEEITIVTSKKHSMDGYIQHMFAAGGLSASIASQLISALTTASPVAGGIAHTVLSVTCIMGLATFIFHAPPLRASCVGVSDVLGYSSLWFATIGIVVLSWAIQPEPVAIAVTIFFGIFVLAIVARSVYVAARAPNSVQNV